MSLCHGCGRVFLLEGITMKMELKPRKMWPCHHCGGEHPIGGPNPCHLLINELNNEHGKACKALDRAQVHMLKAGRYLIRAKSQCKHGEWLQWLSKHFGGSVRTAQLYMKEAERNHDE